ncbi:uncharacterized protein G2W53_015976 [Senna tora]|uniref:Uncharacterized protein n=1 Tax=Senna tora TaxID=362788 RepID=A0A834WWK4_9FABA|nr:uncharacterized protein G2W53_015976 [Senna tora]
MNPAKDLGYWVTGSIAVSPGLSKTRRINPVQFINTARIGLVPGTCPGRSTLC